MIPEHHAPRYPWFAAQPLLYALLVSLGFSLLYSVAGLRGSDEFWYLYDGEILKGKLPRYHYPSTWEQGHIMQPRPFTWLLAITSWVPLKLFIAFFTGSFLFFSLLKRYPPGHIISLALLLPLGLYSVKALSDAFNTGLLALLFVLVQRRMPFYLWLPLPALAVLARPDLLLGILLISFYTRNYWPLLAAVPGFLLAGYLSPAVVPLYESFMVQGNGSMQFHFQHMPWDTALFIRKLTDPARIFSFRFALCLFYALLPLPALAFSGIRRWRWWLLAALLCGEFLLFYAYQLQLRYFIPLVTLVYVVWYDEIKSGEYRLLSRLGRVRSLPPTAAMVLLPAIALPMAAFLYFQKPKAEDLSYHILEEHPHRILIQYRNPDDLWAPLSYPQKEVYYVRQRSDQVIE